jgi:hypothetical protein
VVGEEVPPTTLLALVLQEVVVGPPELAV